MVKYYYTEVPDDDSTSSSTSSRFPNPEACCSKPCRRPRPSCFQNCCNWGSTFWTGAITTFLFLLWLLNLPPCGDLTFITDTTPLFGVLPIFVNICGASLNAADVTNGCDGTAYQIGINMPNMAAGVTKSLSFLSVPRSSVVPPVTTNFNAGDPTTGTSFFVDLGTFTPVTLYEGYLNGTLTTPTCAVIFAP